MRESLIESKIVRFAKQNGWLTYKFTSPQCKGVPDRMFIKDGKLIFVEFKQLGLLPTKLQQIQIDRLREAGMEVHVVDRVELGKQLLCKD